MNSGHGGDVQGKWESPVERFERSSKNIISKTDQINKVMSEDKGKPGRKFRCLPFSRQHFSGIVLGYETNY